MTDTEGAKLVEHTDSVVRLKIDAKRIPTWGENIIARAGDSKKKVVFCAHIDTKENTPGALDNASGVTIMLLLADLLREYGGSPGIEFAAFNGEEYYSTPGQNKYLSGYGEDFSPILIGINMDDIGYIKGRTAFSFYGVPEDLAENIRGVYKGRGDFFEGPPWYQSDHGIFMAKGIPAMAITEEMVLELMAEVTHTEKDTVKLIDLHKLVENAQALAEFVRAVSIRG
jgi:aminopeptidase YwaD